jgi:carbamoyltransferase
MLRGGGQALSAAGLFASEVAYVTAILGLNSHHPDASAALVLDGQLIAAVAEERLGRRLKHDPSFPSQAIQAVLAAGGISAKELTHIAIPHDANANLRAKARYVLSHPISSVGAIVENRRRRRGEQGIAADVAVAAGLAPDGVHAAVVPVEHHLAHIASAYYCSPFDGLTAGFSFDASGDFVSAMAARCEGTRIEVLNRINLPESLGFFYTAACQFIGFDGFGEEYKVMGLAPYGEDRYAAFSRCTVEAKAAYSTKTITSHRRTYLPSAGRRRSANRAPGVVSSHNAKWISHAPARFGSNPPPCIA